MPQTCKNEEVIVNLEKKEEERINFIERSINISKEEIN